jgi:iron complex outermembrane receptor protein
MNAYKLWVSASVLTLAWCATAGAQDTPEEPASSEANVVERIVVTAERRNADLQTTPISATVLTGEALENKGITNVDQLQFISPAATINNFGQGIDFNIRGIGKAEHNTQTTTGVITYRDGVATFPGYFTAEPYYDIARVEILRGPQGTFVGQNATGGAVFVTSNDPVINGGNHGYVAAQIGNHSDFAAQGAINQPLTDELAARISFNLEKRDSFYDITGAYTGDDGVQMASGRLGLLWEPLEELSILFKTDYHFLDFSAYPADPVLGANDPFDITANADLFARDRFLRSVLKMDYSFDDGTIIRSVTGYQWGNSGYRTDLDGTSTGINTFRDSVDETIWSQEVNVISPDDARIRWVVGAYLQTDLHDFLPGEFVIGTPPGAAATEYRLEGINTVQGRAVFGQVAFNLVESLELQLGARYSDSWTKNEGSILQFGVPLVMLQSEKYEDFSGKVSLNWTVNEHHFLYAFVATGFKPGGLNLDVGLGPPAPFDSEKVTSYEAGWKAGFFDGQLRTQLAAFYNDYEDFQVIIGYPDFPTFGFEVNVPGKTKMYGAEAQVEAVFGAFSLDAGMGWLHSEIGTFWAVDPRNPPPFLVALFSQCDINTGPTLPIMAPYCHDLTGQEQTYAPDFTFNIGAQYIFDIGEGDTLTPRINYGHVSQQWATLFEDETRGDKIEARNIVNAQLAWNSGEWTATLYSINLTDQHYVGAINTGLRFAGPPRQFGIRVMKVF